MTPKDSYCPVCLGLIVKVTPVSVFIREETGVVGTITCPGCNRTKSIPLGLLRNATAASSYYKILNCLHYFVCLACSTCRLDEVVALEFLKMET